MGEYFSLPRIYNNNQNRILKELVQKRYLIIEQEGSLNSQHFKPPFHDEFKNEYKKETSWYLNWNKLLHLEKIKTDHQIDNWWSNIPKVDVESINDAETREKVLEIEKKVKEKQENTKYFVDYCRLLYEAANLVFWSEIDKAVDIK